jgi:uncharacterized protein (DUF1501 family)
MNDFHTQIGRGPLLQPLRRALLTAGLALPFITPRSALAATAAASAAADRRILVVFEMSGGND